MKMKKYAGGGPTPKPYKPSAGDLNEKSGGDQEMENRKYMREQEKKKPKPFVESSAVEPANTRRMAEYKENLGLIPDADYRNEAKNAYYDAETGTPRKRVITRNDKDLAAQSRMDSLLGRNRAKQYGGGPGQRPSNYSSPVDMGMRKGGDVKKMASGGMTGARGDGCCTKGKTKGRVV